MLQNLKKATKKHNRKMKNLPRRQNRKRMHKRNNRKRIHKNLLKSQSLKNLITTKNNKTLGMKKLKNLLRSRNLRNRKHLETKKTLKTIVRNLLVHQSIPTMGMESPTTVISHHVLDRDTIIIIILEDLDRSSIRFQFEKVT
uniref:(northern house mosquito) hypothetical protein n=1 Tax=Culex pipiens TaxID=7175 RepID=A0A8D8IFM4_CULPI